MLRVVPFEEIEKNKWNGTVHYSLNGNVYGYHWYLKSVIHEWDAIVEDDYVSVMPIIKTNIKASDYQLLPSLGPYSVNIITDKKYEAYIDLLKANNNSAYYPINHQLNKEEIKINAVGDTHKGTLELIDSYGAITEGYKINLEDIVGPLRENLKVSTSLKPESFVALIDTSDYQKNTLLRLIYNAMHRGIGFFNTVNDEKGIVKAASFFIASHNVLYELATYSSDINHRYILLDFAIRSGAGKPSRILSSTYGKAEIDLGFSSTLFESIEVNKSFFTPFGKWLDKPY